MTGSRADAEDIVQDAISKDVRQGRAKTSVREAEAYVESAIANEAINRARHRLVVRDNQSGVAQRGFSPRP